MCGYVSFLIFTIDEETTGRTSSLFWRAFATSSLYDTIEPSLKTFLGLRFYFKKLLSFTGVFLEESIT